MNRAIPLLLLSSLSIAAHGQYIAIGGGGVFNHGPVASDEITSAGSVAVEGGLPILPFLDGAVHYSFASPQIQQDTRFSPQNLPTHTVTFDARVHTPELRGWRLFGLAGVGFAHFSTNGEPNTGPSSRTQGVFDYGGGVEHRIFGPFRLRAEVRDYFTSTLYSQTGNWNRVAVTGSLVFGR